MAIIFLYAKARALAGKSQYETHKVSLQEIIEELSNESLEMAELIKTCSFLVNGSQSSQLDEKLEVDVRVDVLPRFAGG